MDEIRKLYANDPKMLGIGSGELGERSESNATDSQEKATSITHVGRCNPPGDWLNCHRFRCGVHIS
jgi:hypothetical protein